MILSRQRIDGDFDRIDVIHISDCECEDGSESLHTPDNDKSWQGPENATELRSIVVAVASIDIGIGLGLGLQLALWRLGLGVIVSHLSGAVSVMYA